MEPELVGDNWHPARLLMPLDHGRATAMGKAGQTAMLKQLLAEKWWQDGITDFRVLQNPHTRTMGH